MRCGETGNKPGLAEAGRATKNGPNGASLLRSSGKDGVTCVLLDRAGLGAWAASMACARKAHNVGDNGGAEACSSAPQAACPATLVTLRPLLGVSDPLVPDLILGPRKPLDFGELQQRVRRDTTRFFGTRSQVPTDWAAPAIKPERPRLNRTSMDRRRRRSAR